MGHKLRRGKIALDTRNWEATGKFLPLTSQAKLQSFLGTCNVYRRFVPGFALVAASVTFQEGKNELFRLELTVAKLGAFQELRERLIFPPIIALLRYGKLYPLDIDA